MRLSSLLSYSIPAALFFTAACGDADSDGGDAKFADASEAQRQRAIMAGGAIDAVFAFFQGSFLSVIPETSTCPTIARSGDVITATYNCTDDEGVRIDGRLIATNLPELFGGGNDPTKDATLEAEGYVEHGPLGNRFDGLVVARPDQTLIVALSATLNGLAATTDATFRVAGEDRMTADAGGTIELDGIGSAAIHGTWAMTSDTPSGVLELRGADVLRADFDAIVDGCAPLTVDGRAAGELCMQQSE